MMAVAQARSAMKVLLGSALLAALMAVGATGGRAAAEPPALTDVAAGHVQLMFCDIPPALGLVKEGKVRALGVSTKERVSALPDLLPIAEQGVSGFDAASWQMVVAPAGTPKDIVEQLHGEIKQFLRRPEIRQHGSDMGLLPIDTPSVASLQIFVQTEIARWGKVVEQAGIAGSQ
jgi:tripartite-type tricarboxylate transporter receptor subunit TctC